MSRGSFPVLIKTPLHWSIYNPAHVGLTEAGGWGVSEAETQHGFVNLEHNILSVFTAKTVCGGHRVTSGRSDWGEAQLLRAASDPSDVEPYSRAWKHLETAARSAQNLHGWILVFWSLLFYTFDKTRGHILNTFRWWWHYQPNNLANILENIWIPINDTRLNRCHIEMKKKEQWWWFYLNVSKCGDF